MATLSAAAALTRPRFLVAIVSTAATVTIGYCIIRAARNGQMPNTLRRSNAHRRRSRSASEAQHDRPNTADDGSSTTSASHGDENGADRTFQRLGDANDELDSIRMPHAREARGPMGQQNQQDHDQRRRPDRRHHREHDDHGHERVMDENWWDGDDPSANQHARSGQNIVNLLFRVSEDNARRNAYVHRGCQCNACGVAPIRGIRYRCANCADFDLCETCESQGLHVKTHIFYKIKVPAPPFGPRQMQPVWYPGDPESCLRTLPRSLMAKLSGETGFERPELEAFWEQWTFMASTEWREDPDELCLAMDRRTFERCLVPSGGHRHTAPNLIHDRMFAFYDTNKDDLIGFVEFLHGLSYRKKKDKLRKVFEGYDIDGDGFVDRRDFLRVFRAYYVLYKQMHKDILEGLDDQVMSSTEARQLVTSRQPLSSLFGREGRVPQGERDRFMAGKLYRSNGDVNVTDEKAGVVSEDQPDVLDRETVLQHLLGQPEDSESESTRWQDDQAGFPDSDPRYLRALIDAPVHLEQLPALMAGESRDGDDMFGMRAMEEEGRHVAPSPYDGFFPSESLLVQDALQNGADAELGEVAAEHGSQRTGTARSPFSSSEVSRATRPREGYNRRQLAERNFERARRDLARLRRERREARQRLFDRWTRRQFYLDEEEGGVAPQGWQDQLDVLNKLEAVPEGSSKPLVSPRSRSSSKVRFAQDTDDYEIRSNPSTSSRSVPERWGGMDIADAERDAGKEILYQVTQQAFNELLDILFKEKEDLAVQAAETVEVREQYRDRFHGIDLVKENQREEEERTLKETKTSENQQPSQTGNNEDKPIADGSLSELLQMSGYTIAENGDTSAMTPSGAATESSLPLVASMSDGHREGLEDGLLRESGSRLGERDTVLDNLTDHALRPLANDDQFERSRGEDGHRRLPCPQLDARDPTMPQFRPNAEPLERAKTPTSEDTHKHAKINKGSSSKTSTTGPLGKLNGTASESAPISRAKLLKWKRLDVAEQEARDCGGWGRLNFEKFKEIYEDEAKNANRLDYLGSWIEFCIP